MKYNCFFFFLSNEPIYTQTEHNWILILFFSFYLYINNNNFHILLLILLLAFFFWNKIQHCVCYWQYMHIKSFILIFLLNKWLYKKNLKIDARWSELSLFKSKFFPFIKQVCFRRTKVDNLWTSFAIFFQPSTFYTIKSIRNTWATTNNTATLERAYIQL